MAEESSSALNIVLHPAVIVSITDHFTRARSNLKVAKPRVVGGLVGTQKGRTIEIHSAYELLHDVVDGVIVFNLDFLQKKQKLLTEVEEEFLFLGWYSTGTEPSAEDLTVQNVLREEGINESPLYMVLDPSPPLGTKEMPVTLYESELRIIDSTPTYRFVTAPYSIFSGESERIAVDHVAHLSAVASTESASSVVAHNEGLKNAIENLVQRLDVIVRFLAAVQSGEIQPDPRILRMVKSMAAQIPVAHQDQAFESEFISQYNDTLLTTYLATLTKAANNLNDLVDKYNIVHDRKNRHGAAASAIAGFAMM